MEEQNLQLASDEANVALKEIEETLTEMKDTLRLWEEEILRLKERWEGEAEKYWEHIVEAEMETLFLHMGNLQVFVQMLEELAVHVAKTEREIIGMVETA